MLLLLLLACLRLKLATNDDNSEETEAVAEERIDGPTALLAHVVRFPLVEVGWSKICQGLRARISDDSAAAAATHAHVSRSNILVSPRGLRAFLSRRQVAARLWTFGWLQRREEAHCCCSWQPEESRHRRRRDRLSEIERKKVSACQGSYSTEYKRTREPT